jgi:Tol biopolymer transport system component
MSGKKLAKRRWGLAIAAIACAATAALPPAAGAVLSGTNGRIVFTSARDPFTTATSQLYLRPTFSGVGGPGGPSLITPTSTTQRRHATWSPDRTMIAFSQGDSATSNFDIYVLDLTDPAATPQNITNSNDVTDDRPAWSPDGTRIAWESEVTNGSGQTDILVDTAPFGSGTNLNLTSSAAVDGKPAWSPDSQTLYYSVGDVNVMPNGTNNDVKIFQEPADNSGTGTELVHITGAHAFQPSISPDGTKICFTETGVAGLNTNANVFVASLNNLAGASPLAASGSGDYNCAWSPDGQFIAYVNGVFTSGDLVMERSDNSSVSPIFLETTSGRFDGNPDWAPDGRPQCQDTTVTTTVNTPVSIPIPCADTGPAYEQTSVRALTLDGTGPTQGSVSTTDPQTLPASITYTPNAGFLGTDSFQMRSFDEVAFGDRDGTITINVQPAPPGQGARVLCAGKVSTIVGTGGPDKIIGTPRADVISSLGGNDKVKAGGGNDVVCGGGGKDKLFGQGGKDKLLGQGGTDVLKGGGGKDICKGGKGKDVASACEARKSI